MSTMTQLTRDIHAGKSNPERNMTNGKPFRSAVGKREARASAEKCADGAWRSPVPVMYHRPARGGVS